MASKRKTAEAARREVNGPPADYYQSVINFHRMVGLPVATKPKNISGPALANRNRLMLEELSEYNEAVAKGNIPKIADALADTLVTVFGTAAEHGIPMDEVFRQIHASNMTKKDGHRDKGGKWIKPDNYIPVDLKWLKKLAKK